MSYARSPSEGDVYVIAAKGRNDPEMHWECISCDLLPALHIEGIEFEDGEITKTGQFYWDRQIFIAQSPGQMLTHLRLHRAAGQTVPDRAFLRLEKEHVEWEEKREEEFRAIEAAAKAAWAEKEKQNANPEGS